MKNLCKITVMMMICFFITYSAFADIKPDSLKIDEPSTDIIIEVSGPQSGVWISNNTYEVVGDISVPNGDTLIIEPGVHVEFMDYYSFYIFGTLIAAGTETDSIFFTSGQFPCNWGDWNEIKFEGSSNDNSIISYTRIEYGKTGIYCYSSNPTIINNSIINNFYLGILCEEYSSPIISDNTISNNSYFGILCEDYSSPNISNNTITNNDGGIYLIDGYSSTICNNNISNNHNGIICLYYNGIRSLDSFHTINNNTICNNYHGIFCYDNSPYILNNIICENHIGIELYTEPSSLEYNLFWENNTTAMGGLPDAFGEIVTINANEDPCDIYYNLFMDPLFADPVNFNFHLTENSPCIDAGNPDPIYYDPDETVADIGAFYYDQFQVTQQINLSSGFSFVSSHIIPDNPDMIIVMANVLTDNLNFVRNSLGQTLRKIGPNWVNGIGDWVVEEGYLIKMFSTDSFSINGLIVDPSIPIPVETGFQFVSYFPENIMDALLAFETIMDDNLDYIRNSQGQTLRKIGPIWVNGIGDCQASEGYLVKMFAEGEIIYPASAKSSGKIALNPTYFSFEGGNAADPVYTLYVTGLEICDEVAAYDGNKMLGAVKINSQNAFENELPVFSALINGAGYEEGNPIILKVWSENEIVTTDFTMESVYNSYVSDVYPDGDGRYSIVNITKRIIENKEETIWVYPNPSKGIITIENLEKLSGSQNPTALEITDIVGRIVFQSKIINQKSSIEIDISWVEKGVYFISLSGKDFNEVKKIVIR